MKPGETSEFLPLTARHKDVLVALCQNGCNKRIGKALGLTHLTVGSHLREIFHRIDVHNRVQAAVWAARHLEQQPIGTAGINVTDNERAAVVGLCRYGNKKVVAGNLSITLRGICSRLGNLRGKLGLTTDAQVAAWAVQQGIYADP